MIIELSLAQQITGIVKDLENNEALIGVNIITTNNTGTATDLNGKFTITPGHFLYKKINLVKKKKR